MRREHFKCGGKGFEKTSRDPKVAAGKEIGGYLIPAIAEQIYEASYFIMLISSLNSRIENYLL